MIFEVTGDEESLGGYFATLAHQMDNGPKLLSYGHFDLTYLNRCARGLGTWSLILFLVPDAGGASRLLAEMMTYEYCGRVCAVMLEPRGTLSVTQNDVELILRTQATHVETTFTRMSSCKELLSQHGTSLSVLLPDGSPVEKCCRSILGPDGLPIKISMVA